MNKSKLRYGGFSLVITILFLVAVILLNVFAGALTERYDIKIDLTEKGLYSLDDKAAELLRGIDERVDIIVLADESAWIADPDLVRVVDILKSYSAMSDGDVRVQYVNPKLNTFNGPKFGNSLDKLKEAYAELEGMAENDVILLSDRRATKVNAMDLYSWSYDYYGNMAPTAINVDQQFVSALMYVLSDDVARAVFIEGHDEAAAELLRMLLDSCGYVCTNINIAFNEIPADTTVVIAAAPVKDFTSDEVAKLESYLLTGGTAMIFYDSTALTTPVLDGFLTQWGVEVESKLICDEQYSFMSLPSFVGAIPVSGGLPSLEGADSITAYVGMYNARSIRSLWAGDSWGNFKQSPILRTVSASSYAKDFGSGNPTTLARESGDESGPFTLGYSITMLTQNLNKEQVYARLIVTTGGFIDDTVLYSAGTGLYNISMLAGMANDLNPFGEIVYIAPKALAGEMMVVSAGQARTVLLVMVIAMPLIIAALGMLMWRKRRRL